jgi:hypothetical protein
MKKLILTVALFCNTIAFSQLRYMSGFKKNRYGLYEMAFEDVREAILKYNNISDKNGADTSGTIYNVMQNPIDFAFFKNNPKSGNVIVSILFREDNQYKIMFGEFDGEKDRYFFDITNELGESIQLVYKN